MGKYKCWDCNKELGDLKFDKKIKNKSPRTLDGYILVICKGCGQNNDS